MKIVQSGKKRKAISPVLATVILIAITLIAAIAVAGFVFGLFGTFTSTATVTASVTSCNHSTKVCLVRLYNSGSGTTSIIGCSIAGVTATANDTGTTIAGGATIFGTCTGTGTYTNGAMATGAFTLGNSGQASFSGVWS